MMIFQAVLLSDDMKGQKGQIYNPAVVFRYIHTCIIIHNSLDICRDPPPYPELRSLRYPKVGTENPKVSLHVVNLSDVSSKKTLTPPESIRAQGYV